MTKQKHIVRFNW